MVSRVSIKDCSHAFLSLDSSAAEAAAVGECSGFGDFIVVVANPFEWWLLLLKMGDVITGAPVLPPAWLLRRFVPGEDNWRGLRARLRAE